MYRCLPLSVWKLDRKDFILFFFSSIIRLLIIFTIDPEIFSKSKSHTNYKFLFYQDSIISLHSAKNSFKDKYKTLSPELFICNPLQLHGKYVRIFIDIFNKLFLFLDKNNTKLRQIKVQSTFYGQITSIFISSFIACYAFRRLLSIFHICDYKIQKNVQSKNIISTSPFILTILLTVLPFRFSFLQSCATSDSLFFSFVCFTFIFFNVSNLISTFLFLIAFFAALMTRYEGIVLIPIFTIIIICKIIILIIRKNKQPKNNENSINTSENKDNNKNDKINENKINNKDKKNNENNNDDKINEIKINNKDEKNNENNEDDKIKEDNNKINENNLIDSNKEEDLYDDNSSMLLISLILKLIFIIIFSIFYYYLFKNYGDRPFTLKNYFSHLIFPYQYPNEATKNGDKNSLIAYPFHALLAQAGAITTLRQAHSSFCLFFPLLFSGFLLVTSKSEEVETKPTMKEIQSKTESENQQKAKSIIKEEKNQPKQKSKQKSNQNKFKNNQNTSKKNSSSNENHNQLKKTDEDQIKSQNQEEDNSIVHSSFSPFYQKVTADFMRQIGILVLFFTILASCISTPASFRFLVTAQAFAYPIVAERLINHFLQLLFSTSNFVNSENDKNEVDKKLKVVAVSEKIVFVCGSLILLAALVAWDCLYSRRESNRITFTDLWHKLASK